MSRPVSPQTGLSQREAAELLASVGPNEIPARAKRGVREIVLETAREPLFLFMLGGAVLYLLLGDVGEGLFLVAAALVSVSLVVVQQARSERALAALQDLAQPRARVIRDGAQTLITARELVPGDILLVGEGERIPADALMLEGDVLSVDESTLTGESAPVTKRTAAATEEFTGETTPGAESSPFLFSGTLIVRGQGLARVARTGANSALGRIGASLVRIEHELTPLQKAAGRMVGLLGLTAFAFCVVVAISYGVLREDWIGGALAGLTVGIALVPEEVPMVLAVFLALGAWRLAAHQVLARRAAVIEALGAATVLCVDKTGTLTENRMRLAKLYVGDRSADAAADDPQVGRVLYLARMASATRPVDPMDRAIDARRPLASGAPSSLVRSWPLRAELMAVIQLWREDAQIGLAAAKGAPEAIFRLCRLNDEKIAELHAVIADFAQDGMRVLGVASATAPPEFDGDPASLDFAFAGLVAFLDPLRADAPQALEEARAAGVKVVMITGDHPATALSIARAAGIDVAAGVMTGADVAALPFPTLCERLRSVRVFARITPEQKLLLVEALRADGEIVAMTGDGVNDAPALEAAHIGIAMGRRGSDVAREAADLVLLDDSFASIVGGVRLGRRIFANLRNALTYITAIHVPIAGLALAPILFGLPPMLFPMHVVLLELAIDPTCALVFEAERSEAAAMKRPPRRADEPLFGLRQVLLALVQGGALLVGVFGLYFWALGGFPEHEARGGAFIALTIGNLALAMADSLSSARVFGAHRRIYWLIAIAIVLVLAMIFVVPGLAAMFGVALPPPALLALALTVALGGGAWAAALRALVNRPPGRLGETRAIPRRAT